MTLLSIAIGAVAAMIVAFFVWANRRTAREHARFTARDVENALKNMLDPHARTHDEWDLLLAWPIDDPYLESVRQECRRIWGEDRSRVRLPGRDMSEEGEKRVAAVLKDLQRRRDV